MLDIKVAVDDPQSMSQDGSSILRSLQNNTLPIVDLIVRESLQNSLDAAIPKEKTTDVQFVVGNFDSFKLSALFSGIQDTLRSNGNYLPSFLAISDKKTTGLTGVYTAENSEELAESNFHKLVFGIGKNQEKEGAGGSWGLGKTSYFRMGIGLVIYYTRIELANGQYEERLIASGIEDNKKKDRLMPKSNRGIAWWGRKKTSDHIEPLTNRDEIKEILDIFNFMPYNGDETGTTIIIPYLNEEVMNKKYIDNTIEKSCYWLGNLEDEIKMAVQRWYFPRINNSTYNLHFKQSMLRCKVNGELIFPENFEPTFRILQELYNSALLGNPVKNSIKVVPIKLSRIGLSDRKKPVGYVAFCEVSREEVGMTPPNNAQSPFAFLGNFDKQLNESHDGKFIGYCRKPGMIVEYDFSNNWLPNGSVQSDQTMLFSLFVPTSNEKLDPNHYELYSDVESYLRSLENADHANWLDKSGYSFVKRIKNGVSKEIKGYYQKKEESEIGSATSKLSRELGDLLLPPTGFGSKPSVKKQSSPKKTIKSSLRSSLGIEAISIIDDKLVDITVSGRIAKNKEAMIKLLVSSQEGNVYKEEWEKNFSKISFPFEIMSFELLTTNPISCRLEEGVLYFDKIDTETPFRIRLRIRKYSNQYSPVVVISS